MKQQEFDMKKAEWDRFKAFHIASGPGHSHSFIQFDTEEFICTRSSYHVDNRTRYPDQNIQIVGTIDKGCPRFYKPGDEKPIPSAWLTEDGIQQLWIDLDHKMVVGLGYNCPTKETWPERIQHINPTVYYQGPESKPQGSPIKLYPPNPKIKEYAPLRQELMLAATAWREMEGNSLAQTLREIYYYKPEPMAFYLAKGATTLEIWNKLDELERLSLPVKGFSSKDRIAEEVPYLEIRG